MKLSNGQKVLLHWQVMVGVFGIIPAVYIMFAYVSALVSGRFDLGDMVRDPAAIGFQVAGLIFFITLLAGIALWVICINLSTQESYSPSFLSGVTSATLVTNLTLAAICFSLPVLMGRATWPFNLIIAAAGLYPLFIAWLWYRCFVAEPSRRSHIPAP